METTRANRHTLREQEPLPTLYARAVVTFAELMDVVDSVPMKDELAKRVIDYMLHFKLQCTYKGFLWRIQEMLTIACRQPQYVHLVIRFHLPS